MVVASNGPASAVTPATWPVAASRAAAARPGSAVTVASAPRWAANAFVNGELLALSRARPRVAEAVAISSTATITTACTLCLSTPPDAVRTGPSHCPGPVTGAPRSRPCPLAPGCRSPGRPPA